MDPATAAALAALAISVLAMGIALAQAVQQYFLTGQSIRICDSVVYGPMPGQGRRVWEGSQLRFRVVYSIPQICLRPELWAEAGEEDEGNEEDVAALKRQHALPDLRHTIVRTRWYESQQHRHQNAAEALLSPYSAVPGEAGWVSFCRAMQYSAGQDLLYEMVDGDADRCPCDLPVVPMQVAMRDIVTVALMSGMTCTDASFAEKSLAMEGPAGVITSSQHPILGALLRFAPKNSKLPPGLRIHNGSVHPDWMARLWDTVVVAGRHYSSQERKYYLAYETHCWVELSPDMAIARYQAVRQGSRASSPVHSFRSRSWGHSIHSNRSISPRSVISARLKTHFVHGLVNSEQKKKDGIATFARSPQDGDWSFTHTDLNPKLKADKFSSEPSERAVEETYIYPRKAWYPRWMSRHSKQLDPHNKPYFNPRLRSSLDVEKCDIQSRAPRAASNGIVTYSAPNFEETRLPMARMVTDTSHLSSNYEASFAHRARGKNLLDGPALQRYIDEKQRANSTGRVRKKLLLLPSFPGEGIPEVEEPIEPSDDWQQSYVNLSEERGSFYTQRWRDILSTRQRRREMKSLEDEALNSSFSRQSSPNRTARRTQSQSSRVMRSHSQLSNLSHRDWEDPDLGDSRGRARRRRSFHGERALSLPDAVMLDPRPVTFPEDSKNQAQSPTEKRELFASYGEDPLPIQGSADMQVSVAEDSPSNPGSKELRKPRVAFSLNKQVIPSRSFHEANENFIEGDPAITDRPALIERSKNKEPNLDDEIRGVTNALNPTPPPIGRREGILKRPKEHFPEEPDPIRPGIASKKNLEGEHIPEGARWTRIDRRIVSPEALERGNERFEERDDSVIVLRVLTRDEVETYAKLTREISSSEFAHNWEELEETESPYQLSLSEDPSPAAEGTSYQEFQAGKGEDSVEGKTQNLPTRRNDRGSASEANHADPAADGNLETEHSTYNEQMTREASKKDRKRRRKSPTLVALRSRSRSRSRSRQRSRPTRDISPRSVADYNSVLNSRTKVKYPRSLSFSDHQPVRQETSSTIDISEALSEIDSDGEHFNEGALHALEHANRSALATMDSSVDPPTESSYDGNQKDGRVNWFWICQADVIPGYVATPWKDMFSVSVCSGAIAVLNTALEWFTEDETLVYVDSLPHCDQWVYDGRSTHPSYAINAMGGIVLSGKFTCTRFRMLATPIPPIELLRDLNDPGGFNPTRSQRRPSKQARGPHSPIKQLAELMALDTWLAFCGRLPEIYNGRNNLIRTMPTLVQKLMDDFSYEFGNVDRTAAEGGWQIMNEMADLVLHELNQLVLEEAEQLFTLVALLRAAKMALAVSQGSSTDMLQDVLLRDVPVYLV